MSECLRSHLRKSLDDFFRQARHSIKRESCWDTTPFVLSRSLDLSFLAAQVTSVFDRRLNACDVDVHELRIEVQLNLLVDHEMFEAHFRPAKHLDSFPGQPAKIRVVPSATGRERVPAAVIDKTCITPPRCQPQVRVIDSQQQPVLGPRGKHTVRLEATFRNQVVDKNSHVGFVPLQLEPSHAANRMRCIDSGDESLRRSLFVPGGAVDLAGEKQPSHALCFQASGQLRRLYEVVLDGVARPKHDSVAQSRKGVNKITLHVARQACRKAIYIDLWRVDTFRLQKKLMTLLVGKTNDFVLERRTISRANALNLTIE